MMTRIQKLSWAAIAGLTLSCTSLEAASNPSPSLRIPPLLGQLTGIPTAISDIPQQEPDSRISLEGTVSRQAPLLEGGLYQLQDDTGTVWIMTTEPLPAIGTQVRITGQIRYTPILISGNDLGEHYIQETQRHNAGGEGGIGG